jgi:hypothetical protein
MPQVAHHLHTFAVSLTTKTKSSVFVTLTRRRKERNMKKRMLTGLICLAMIAFLSAVAIASEEPVVAPEESVIVGTIMENNQIVDQDGQSYVIKQVKEGDNILELVGKKVQIKGTVLEADGQKTIEMVSYELVEEQK